MLFFFQSYCPHRDLPSFPTRRSSDLDLPFLQEQLLDLYDMDFGIMNPLSPTGQGDQNPDFSAAMAYAAEKSGDRKSTRLNSSHSSISYAVFCLKKKKNKRNEIA